MIIWAVDVLDDLTHDLDRIVLIALVNGYISQRSYQQEATEKPTEFAHLRYETKTLHA